MKVIQEYQVDPRMDNAPEDFEPGTLHILFTASAVDTEEVQFGTDPNDPDNPNLVRIYQPFTSGIELRVPVEITAEDLATMRRDLYRQDLAARFGPDWLQARVFLFKWEPVGG